MKLLVAGLVSAILVLMLCISGCTSPSANGEAPPAGQPTAAPTTPVSTPAQVSGTEQSLVGATWYLVAFRQGSGSENVLPGTEITAFFDGSGTVSGSAGCNHYSASYTGILNGLSIGAPVATKMNCNSPPGTMTQESLYLTAIRGAATFRIAGDILTVFDSGRSAILTYTRIKPGTEPSTPLTGATWYLESYVDAKGEIFTLAPQSTVSLQFDGAGNLSGNAGCNSYFGPYSLGDGQILTIGTIGRTLMACTNPDVMEQENDYLLVLPEMKVYSISGNDLIMNDGTGKYTLTFSTRKS